MAVEKAYFIGIKFARAEEKDVGPSVSFSRYRGDRTMRRRRAEELCGKRRARRLRDSHRPSSQVSRSPTIALFLP